MLETQRLKLIPLTANQLKLWMEDISFLEKELNCNYQAEPVEGFFRKIVEGQYNITLEDNETYLYHTFWFIIRKSDGTVVGTCDFKDLPNKLGEVEIGYGLGKDFEHNGYMTEAIDALCNWGLAQETIQSIIAETETDNLPSQRVLLRCGFKQYKQDESIWWTL